MIETILSKLSCLTNSDASLFLTRNPSSKRDWGMSSVLVKLTDIMMIIKIWGVRSTSGPVRAKNVFHSNPIPLDDISNTKKPTIGAIVLLITSRVYMGNPAYTKVIVVLNMKISLKETINWRIFSPIAIKRTDKNLCLKPDSSSLIPKNSSKTSM